MSITRQYYAADGARINDTDAQVVGEELEGIGGCCGATTVAIVDAARPVNSRLHKYFCWDDQEAAELHRQHQARVLASSVVVRIIQPPDTQPQTVRAFHSVIVKSDAPLSPRSYVSVNTVAKSDDLSQQVTAEALRQLSTWRHRYTQYRSIFPAFDATFNTVFEAIESVAAD